MTTDISFSRQSNTGSVVLVQATLLRIENPKWLLKLAATFAGPPIQNHVTSEIVLNFQRVTTDDNHLTWNDFRLYGKTGENFPPNRAVQLSTTFHLYAKKKQQHTNSCSFVGESNGTVLLS